MFIPLYNDEFTARLETIDASSDTQAMAKLLPDHLLHHDQTTNEMRPALKYLFEAGDLLRVEPSEVLYRLMDDALFQDAEDGDPAPIDALDFLVEMRRWLETEEPARRSYVLAGLAVHRRARAEDRQAMTDQTSPTNKSIDPLFQEISEIITSVDHKAAEDAAAARASALERLRA
jgi:hypothetical protein